MIPKPLFVVLALSAPCLWDRDTLRAEVQGAPGIAEVAVGWFDQFPDVYYEARLVRCAELVEGGDPDLGLLDDAAVACDRLQRADAAIEWMERKAKALEGRAEPDPFHEYTYLANLGTFHAHRWLRSGADRSDLVDLEQAYALLAAAIAKNPDAHFGRERYQLLAIEWLLEPLAPTGDLREPSLLTKAVGSDLMFPSPNTLDDSGFHDAVEGLAGLVHLGDAWNSGIVWLALTQALVTRGDASLARLAALRLAEIVTANPAASPFEGFDAASFLEHAASTLRPEAVADVDRWFERARPLADAWRASRNDYITAQIAAGTHPDEDSDFWARWRAPAPLPPFEGGSDPSRLQELLPLVLAFAAVAAIYAWRRSRA